MHTFSHSLFAFGLKTFSPSFYVVNSLKHQTKISLKVFLINNYFNSTFRIHKTNYNYPKHHSLIRLCFEEINLQPIFIIKLSMHYIDVYLNKRCHNREKFDI